jgi:hypothetical protein
MKMEGFRGDAMIAWGSRGVRQNSRKRKFGFSSNSLRSGPPNSSIKMHFFEVSQKSARLNSLPGFTPVYFNAQSPRLALE